MNSMWNKAGHQAIASLRGATLAPPTGWTARRSTILKFVSFACILFVALAASAPAWAQANPKNAQGEEFFIISSVNMQKHQVVLMRPTQLTVVASFSDNTTYTDEKGQKLAISAMKAGDTVWAVVKRAADGTVTVLRLRQGAMTPAELHKLYLRNSSGGTISMPMPRPAPMTPRPLSGAQAAHPLGRPAYLNRLGRDKMRPHGPGADHIHS